MSSASNPNQGTSNQTIKEDLIELSKVFIEYFTIKCEEKLIAYLRELEPNEETKATETIKKIADIASIIPLPYLENVIKSAGIILPISSIRREIVNEKKLILNGKDNLRELLVEAGGYIFWSYQNQFIDVTDIHDDVTVGMQKLAIDAVDQTFDFIENCESEYLESGFINIAISAIFSPSKTSNVISKGQTIKYKGFKCQTASLYEGVSIVKMDVNGNYVHYKSSKSNHEKYGYRLASSEGACDLSEYKMYDWEENVTVKKIITINDMKPHLIHILNKINKKDPDYLQQTTKNNTDDELIIDTTEIKQNQVEMEKKTTANNTVRKHLTIIKDFLKTIKHIILLVISYFIIVFGNKFYQYRLNKIIKYVSLFVIPIIGILVYQYSIKTDSTNRLLDTNLIECHKVDGLQDVCFPKQYPEPLWFDIKEPVKSFNGRVEILKSLHNALQNNQKEQVVLSQTAVITGLGGIGKTELARKYIYDYKTNYTNVIWIKSETQQIFKESFHKVAIKLKLSIKENIQKEERERDLTLIIEDIYVYFKNSKTLIILDNADKFDDIKHFLDVSVPPNIAKPFILITSRNQNWNVAQEGTIKNIQLNEFTLEESFNFIRISLLDVNSTNEEVNQLAIELQNFPLALSQATAYINMMQKQSKMQGKQTFRITDYLFMFNNNKSKLLKFKPSVGYERYFETIYTTWIVTLQKIEENDDALKIIEFMAYLKPDSIDVEICFSNYFDDKNDMWNVIGLLHQYSMINIVNGVANIHRLVQQVIRIKLKEEKKEEEVLKSALFILRRPEDLDSIYEHNGSLWNFASYYKQLIFDNYFEYKYGDSFEISPLHLLVLGDYVTAVENIIKCFENNKLFDINVLCGKNFTPLQTAVYGNHFNMTILLISKGADVNIVDVNDNTLLHYAAYHGHINIIKYLLNSNLIDYKTRNKDGDTPLHIAVWKGGIEIIELFISKGADVSTVDEYDNTLLHIAAYNGHINIITYLLNINSTDVDTRNKFGNTPLHLAVSEGYIDIIELFLSKGADIYFVNKNGDTLLHIAAYNGHINIIKYLLNLYLIDVETRNKDGDTPLHLAVWKGGIEIIELFISKGADVSTVDEYDNTLLHIAAYNGHINIITYLLNINSTDVDTRNKFGNTPLHLAVSEGYIDIIELFLSKGADIYFVNKNGDTLLHIAAYNGHINIIKYLLNLYLIDVETRNKDGDTPLHLAVWKGYIEILDLFLLQGGDVNTVDKYGNTLLHTATRNGHIDIIKYLLELNLIDVDIRNKDGNTPLHIAVSEGYIEIIELFLSKGADVSTVDEDSSTLLHSAAFNGHTDIIKYLLNLNLIDVDIRNKDGNTPLHITVYKGYIEILDLFLLKGGDVNTVDKYGYTLLHTAARNGHIDIIKYLLELNLIDVDIRNSYGNTPLLIAVYNGHISILELFISKGADISIVDENGSTLLHSAASNGYINIIEYLLNLYLIDVDIRSKDGNTPLHFAVWKGYLKIVKLLIHNKADVNVVNKNDYTLLHFAAMYGHIDIITYLLNSTQINIYAKDKHGHTPLHFAVWKGYIEIVKILTSNGDNFDVVKQYGSELLHYAIKYENIDIINYLFNSVLINNRANGYKDSTPLKHALGKSYKDIIKQLKSKGADIIVEDEDDINL